MTIEICEKTLWALGWSAACLRNGFEIGQSVVAKVIEQYPGRRDGDDTG